MGLPNPHLDYNDPIQQYYLEHILHLPRNQLELVGNHDFLKFILNNVTQQSLSSDTQSSLKHLVTVKNLARHQLSCLVDTNVGSTLDLLSTYYSSIDTSITRYSLIFYSIAWPNLTFLI